MEENNILQNENTKSEGSSTAPINAKNDDTKVSMNKKEKKYALIIKVFVILCILGLIILAVQKLTKKQEMDYVSTQTINVTHLKYGDIEREISVPGTVQPIDNFTVNAKCSGEVKRIYVRNGDTVHTGDKICEIDNQTAIEAALITYDQAKSTFERYEKLYNSGNLSKQEYENYKSSYDKAKLDYETQIDYATPTANGDGVIDGLSLSLNNLVSNGQVLCYINSEGFNEVRLGVSERVLHGINIGDKVSVVYRGLTYDAEVVSTSKQVGSNGQFEVKAMITTENNLASGITAKCTFVYERADNVAYINRDIVYYEGEKPYVYTVTSENTIEKKFLETGIENDENIVVISGVDNSTKIISTWSNDLSEGALVNINVEDPIETKKETTAKVVNDEDIDDEYSSETTRRDMMYEKFYDRDGELESLEQEIANLSEDEINEDLIKYQMMEPVIASISNINLEEDKIDFEREIKSRKSTKVDDETKELNNDYENINETYIDETENNSSNNEETTTLSKTKLSSTKNITNEEFETDEKNANGKLDATSLDDNNEDVAKTKETEETAKKSTKLALSNENRVSELLNVNVTNETTLQKETTSEFESEETTSASTNTSRLTEVEKYRAKFEKYKNSVLDDLSETIETSVEE